MKKFIFLIFVTIVAIATIFIYNSVYLFNMISAQIGYALLILSLPIVLITREILIRKSGN